MDRCDDMATRPAKASGNPVTAPAPEIRERPRALRLAAAGLAVEAVGMCVAAGFSAVSTAAGQSYQRAAGIALTLLAVGTAVVFALFARGLAKASPWTRTPVVMTQLAIGVWAIYLLRDHRLEWGVPMLLVAVCCLAALFTPASLRALNRPPSTPVR
jgi:drug/metabolite transporter (DMT)-like permease